ncbi:MAG TPA: DUF4197 domain-containing protein [Burkholderiales bacterium]|jgi:hypothetical protein|nr:DUF4197 domain-containing protein [Burkholderiales bacterium]
MGKAGLAVVGIVLSAAAAAASLPGISEADAVAGLKTALEKGTQAAVAKLGRTDGFLGNQLVRIALPESAQRAERMMRRVGMGKYADELIVTMNRAAEAAVPEARSLFVQSVRKMTLRDAKGILTGGDTAATDYFRRSAREPLHQRFLPIVRGATAKVQLARAYDRYAGKAAAVGLMREQDTDLDEYVTQKALDGLFLMVAEEEKQVRADPLKSASSIVRKVFGALQ